MRPARLVRFAALLVVTAALGSGVVRAQTAAAPAAYGAAACAAPYAYPHARAACGYDPYPPCY